MRPNLLISFSGGETSAFMTIMCRKIQKLKKRWNEVVVVFANTGEENAQTLEFVRRCDEHFDFGTVWVEAEVHHGERIAATHRTVTFETASRHGEPYESHIQKYGIPNQKFKDCSRGLKKWPIDSYVKNELGWARGYETAIGIRADEGGRRAAEQRVRRIVYPLLDWAPMTKPMVNEFWAAQDFRLELKGYQGNCKWCWKKSFRKLLTVMMEHPEYFDFPEKMERLYGKVGPEFVKDTSASPLPEGYRRTFFRGNLSVKDLRAMLKAQKTGFNPAEDDAVVMPNGEQVSLDWLYESDNECSESCEIDFGDGVEHGKADKA